MVEMQKPLKMHVGKESEVSSLNFMTRDVKLHGRLTVVILKSTVNSCHGRRQQKKSVPI